ncbi:MAG TPA: YecA family protein [Moraxellaceae bacterium]
MHPPAHVPSLDELAQALTRLNTGCSASELHGVLTGLLAGGARLNRSTLQKVLETHSDADQAFGDEVMASLWQLQLKTLEDLGDTELIFMPLLPDDDDDLAQRVTALSDWCQGFLVGFGTAVRPNDTRIHGETVRETLQDIVHVANVDASAQDNDEGDESAYAELYEFVRMAVIHLFEELAPPEEQRGHDEADPDSPTLH